MSIDLRTRGEIRAGWWIEERASVLCALPKDGLIVVFKREDVEAILDAAYPHIGQGDRKVWFFNNSKDREIAEIDSEGRISANPQVLWEHFIRK